MTPRERREEIVRNHVEAECRHDPDATVATFHHPRYEVLAMGATVDGAEEVHGLVSSLVTAFPDFHAEIKSLHHADAAVICEIRITGTHQGPWMGMDGTGNQIDIPCGCFFEFDEDRLMCEKVYFDGATMQRQLAGVRGAAAS